MTEYPDAIVSVATSPMFWLLIILFVGSLYLVYKTTYKLAVMEKSVEDEENEELGSEKLARYREKESLYAYLIFPLVLTGAGLLVWLWMCPQIALNNTVNQALKDKYDVITINKNSLNGWENRSLTGRTKTVEFKNCWVTLNNTPENIELMCTLEGSSELVDLNTLDIKTTIDANTTTESIKPLSEPN